MRKPPKTLRCRRCQGRMLIASCSLVCENGCGRLRILPTSERQRLARAFPELVIECVPVSKMRVSSY